MEELLIRRMPNGQIHCEWQGSQEEISVMLCEVMVDNIEIAATVCGAIPAFLDVKKIPREDYCKMTMDAVGNR